MIYWRCVLGRKCQCRLTEKEACRNWRAMNDSGIGNIAEGPIVGQLRYVFRQLGEMGVKTEAQRASRE